MVEHERTFVMKKQKAFFILVQIFLIVTLACPHPEAQVAPPAPPVSGPTPAVKVEAPPPAETKPAAVPPTAPQPGGPAEKPAPPPVKPAEAEKPTPPPVAPPAVPAPATTPAPTRPASPPSSAVPSRPRGQGVVFKFDNADLYEVIRTMAEILKINYVIDPKVRGTVNINTSGAISQEDIYPLFLSILRMNGATIVKRDSVYEIVPIAEGKKLPGAMPGEGKKAGPEDRFAIEIIKPSYIPITELEKIIKPFLSDEKEVVPYPQSNILIVADLLSNIRKIRDIIGLFDVDIFTDKTIGIFPVSNSDATDVSKDLERIFTSLEVPSKSGRGIGITFTPIARLNAVLVVSSIPGILDKVENWIKELDKAPTDESKMWVQVYYVQNTKAKDLAEVLKQIYAKGKETVKPRAEEPKAPTPTPAPAPRTTRTTTRTEPTPAPTPAAKEEPGAVAEGEINIVVDEVTNALIVRSRYRDYRAILETIKKLDLYPKQVLIEVMIAEITLDDSLNYGLEWFRFITSQPPNAQEITVSGRPPNKPFDLATAAGTVFGGGVRYAIVALGERLAAAIHAAAAENRLNIISSPHLLASNNKEAKIQIGSEEPIITQTYTSGTSTTVGSDILGQSIEYKDVGIIMTLTPRISDAGLITLEIEIEDSQVGTTGLGADANFVVPRFLKKVAKTTLSVLEGQIIVIGGLIGDTKTANKSGVPYLNKVPVFGGLFGTQNSKSMKTETIIVMTPHIITDAMQSRTVTQEFRQKVRGIQEEIQRRETGAAPPPKAPSPSAPPPEAPPQYEFPVDQK